MTADADPAAQASLRSPRVLIPFVLVVLIWGSTWLVIRDQLGVVPPGWSVTWRFALAAAAMFALAAFRREPLGLGKQGQMLALALGALQFTLNFQFVYRAEQYLTSGVVAVLYAMLMLPNALLARVFLKQRITARFAAGSAIALVGIALLLVHEARLAPLSGQVGLGVALTAAGILSASAANILQATERARALPMLSLLAWAMAWGAGIDAVAAWVLSGPPQFEARLGYLAGVAYLALAGSVVAFPIYFELIRVLGPGRAAYNGVAVPVVAMLLSTLFESYRWSWLAVAGGTLAMAGLVVAMRARKPSR